MTLKQYQAFISVAQCRSFSQAAELSQLSQPTLSRLIKQLEVELEVELIDRYHRPLQLTEVGDFFYKNLNTLMQEIDTLSALTKKMGKPSNTLTIGFVPSILYGLLPDVIALLKQQNPTLQLQLRDVSSYDQIKELKSGQIDVGLGRFTFEDSHTQQILLRREKYVLALPINHPLSLKKMISLADLVSETLILYNRTHLPKTTADSVTDPLLNIFDSNGITPHNTSSVSDLQIALGLVAAEEGFTLVPESLKTERTAKIAYIDISNINAISPIYLQTLATLHHPAVEKLLQAIYEVYECRNIEYISSNL